MNEHLGFFLAGYQEGCFFSRKNFSHPCPARRLVESNLATPVPRHLFQHECDGTTAKEGHHDCSYQENRVDEHPHFRPEPEEGEGEIRDSNLGRERRRALLLRQKEQDLYPTNGHHNIIARGPACDRRDNEGQRYGPKPPADICRICLQFHFVSSQV
jgi:hypothetical protein